IENVSIDRLASFYRKYYQPDNALLAITGAFDTTKTLGWIAASFGAIPRPPRKLEPGYTIEPVQEGERAITLRRIGDTPTVMSAYHTPAGSHPDSAPLEVLAGVLGDTPSGRLHKALVENKKAVSAGMFSWQLHDPGVMM